MKLKSFTALTVGPTILLLLLVLTSLSGCLFDVQTPENQLIVSVDPTSGYPPVDVAIVASGVTDGQYSFLVEGHTYTQGDGTKIVTIHSLPCEGEVIWERPGFVAQTATFLVTLDNEGPIIGTPRLNGLEDLWYIHPRYRYIVDFPGAYDPDGGPVTLVSVTVQASLKDVPDTVYCPPYEGPDVYHAKDRNGRMIENAFVFHSLWTGPTDAPHNIYPFWKVTRTYYEGDKVNKDNKAWKCLIDGTEGSKKWNTHWKKIGDAVYGTNLPFSPPGYGESGYPGTPLCGEYDNTRRAAQTTTITATFRDEQGDETEESWVIPTGPDPGCNTYSAEE